MTTHYYIYEIKNTIDNKIYIGSTKNPQKRWSYHIHCDKDVWLYQHMKKHGIINFTLNVIDEIETDDYTAVLTLEQKYIKLTDPENRLNMQAAILSDAEKKEWREKYTESRKEIKKEYDREYTRTHVEQCKLYKQRWSENNPNYSKEYRQKNLDKIRQAERIRRELNRDKINAKNRVANLTFEQIEKKRLYANKRTQSMTEEQKEKRRKYMKEYMKEYMKRPEQQEKHRLQEAKRRERLKNKNIS